MPAVLVTLPINMRLEVNQTAEGTTAKIAPVHTDTNRHGDPSQQE